ncbi:MAG: tetratricopeptide repeat protein, partial [Acidobacteria bacterium]|nr:tetratricopeptide repeat protein [Acidobacteriota bacterium]
MSRPLIFTLLLWSAAGCAGADSEPVQLIIALNDQAAARYRQARYAEAEPLFQRALALAESALGPEHHQVALIASNL